MDEGFRLPARLAYQIFWIDNQVVDSGVRVMQKQ